MKQKRHKPEEADPHSPQLARRSRMAKEGPAGPWWRLDRKQNSFQFNLMTKHPLTTLPCLVAVWLAGSSPSGGTEFDDLLASFGNLGTIAGTGFQEDTNGWLPAYEGAAPVVSRNWNRRLHAASWW